MPRLGQSDTPHWAHRYHIQSLQPEALACRLQLYNGPLFPFALLFVTGANALTFVRRKRDWRLLLIVLLLQIWQYANVNLGSQVLSILMLPRPRRSTHSWESWLLLSHIVSEIKLRELRLGFLHIQNCRFQHCYRLLIEDHSYLLDRFYHPFVVTVGKGSRVKESDTKRGGWIVLRCTSTCWLFIQLLLFFLN